MKQAQYIFLSLAALTGLAACSSDSDLTPSSRSEGNAVVVKASVGKGSIFTRTNPAGTPEEQKVFNPGDEIALTDGTKTVNYTLDKDGTTWNPSTPGEYLVWGNGTMNFKAYYPVGKYYDGTNDNYTNRFDKGGVQTNQGDIAKSDYMTATATETKPYNHTLNLNFERQTARIVVKINGYNNQFSELTPRITSCYINGAIDASQNVKQITPLTVKDDSKNPEYMALVYPGEAKPNEYFLSITVVHNDDGYGETETEVFLKGIPAFEAGNSYTFSLTVGKDKLTIEDVTVEDWTTGAVIPGGEAEEPHNIGPGLTAAYVGKVVASDGSIYPTKADAEADGKTAVAMIAYVGNDTGDDTYKNGLAISLDYAKNVSIALGGNVVNEFEEYIQPSLSAPTNSSKWKAPTINNFKHIFDACGGTPYTSEKPTSGQSCYMGDLQDKLEACGGKEIPDNYGVYTADKEKVDRETLYWSYKIGDSTWNTTYNESTSVNVFAVFAF